MSRRSQQPAAGGPLSRIGHLLSGGRSFLLFLLAFIFTGLALWQLALVNQDLRPSTFVPLLALAGCGGLAAYFLHFRRQPGDPLLLPLVYLLTGLGLALIARLSPRSDCCW